VATAVEVEVEVDATIFTFGDEDTTTDLLVVVGFNEDKELLMVVGFDEDEELDAGAERKISL
jgi:hypothetical protein